MRIGVDLGGSKIEALALDEEGRCLLRHRRPTPKQDYSGTIQAILESVEELERALGQQGSVGVGMPGALSPQTGRVKNANSTWLNGRAFDQDLSKALKRPVRFANDANCLAVSEAVDGAAAGATLVFAGILGTGCGAGLAFKGRAYEGPNAIAGEWGHCPLPWPHLEELPGPGCYCGLQGCIETWISGSGFQADHLCKTGEALSAPEIIQRAQAREPRAQASFERYLGRLARSLAQIVNILDPGVIVLGGGISNVEALYPALPALMAPYIFGGECVTPIRRALHGDSSGVRGAAWLWD